MSMFHRIALIQFLLVPRLCFAQTPEEASSKVGDSSQTIESSQRPLAYQQDSETVQALQPAVAAVMAGALTVGLGAALWKIRVINRSVGIPLIIVGGAGAAWGIYEGLSLDWSKETGTSITWSQNF